MLRLTLLFLMCQFMVFSQYKFEKEDRISAEDVPVLAKEFINDFNFSKKIKWYVEESQSGKSFEAKTYFKKLQHSIEFDTSGKLIDAEIKVKFSTLPSDVKDHIKKTLSNLFKKYKIEKTQIQYIGSNTAVYSAILTPKAQTKKAIVNYELVVKGNPKNQYVRYEFLFDKNGVLLKKLPFATENIDNIEF